MSKKAIIEGMLTKNTISAENTRFFKDKPDLINESPAAETPDDLVFDMVNGEPVSKNPDYTVINRIVYKISANSKTPVYEIVFSVNSKKILLAPIKIWRFEYIRHSTPEGIIYKTVDGHIYNSINEIPIYKKFVDRKNYITVEAL